MENDFIKTEILLEKQDLSLIVGERLRGKVIFQPKTDLFVEVGGMQLIFEGHSKYQERNNIIIEEKLIRNKKLLKGKTYQFPIEIEGMLPITYHGENMNIEWKLKSFFELRPNYYLKLRNAYLKKRGLSHGLHSTSSDQLLSYAVPITMLGPKSPYQVKNYEKELHASSVLPMAIFAGGMIGSFFIIDQLVEDNSMWIFLGTLVVLFIFTLFPYLLKESILKSVNVNTTFLGDNNFAVILGLSKNIKNIKKVKVHYTITEKVKEKHGDSDISYKKKIFQSEIIEKSHISHHSDSILDFPDLAYDFIFDLPDKKIPVALSSIRDLRFEWKMNIQVYFALGLKSTFTKQIFVEYPKGLK